MKHVWAGAIAVSLLAACGGGNPFTTTTGTGTGGSGTPSTTIPAAIQNDLGSFSFNSTTGVLTIQGVNLDANGSAATYVRDATLDQPGGYLGYTSQEDGLSRHSTAYVKQIDGTSAVVVVTGPQFGQVFGGASYVRSGDYDPPGSNTTPNGGLVSYGGRYVGLLNASGDGGALLTPPAGVDPSLLPAQAAEIRGDILINADFTDNSVNGRITNRVIPDNLAATPEDLDLEVATIAGDGTFTSNVLQGGQNRGTYGGIFGGVESTVVAGALTAADHISRLSDEEEFGIFVLVQCGQPGAAPVC